MATSLGSKEDVFSPLYTRVGDRDSPAGVDIQPSVRRTDRESAGRAAL